MTAIGDGAIDDDAPVALPWHVSDRLHARTAADRRSTESIDEVDDSRPLLAVDHGRALDPLWKRVLTGKSFGWRYRRFRNRLRYKRRRAARGLIRRMQMARVVRRARQRLPWRDRLRLVLTGQFRVPAIATELRLDVAVAGTPAGSPAAKTLEPLLAASRPDSSVTIDVGFGSAMTAVTDGPASFLLRTDAGERWFAAQMPHRVSPMGMPARPEPTVMRLERVVVDELSGRKRSRLITAARRVKAFDCSSTLLDPLATARLLVDLAAAGAALVAGSVPPDVATLLGPELTDLIESRTDRQMDDARVREGHVVALRRTVDRTHSIYANLRDLAALHGRAVTTRPSVSILMATNRPAMVSFAVEQMARQHHDDVEILCGVHGFSVPDEERAHLAATAPNAQLVEVGTDHDLGQVLALLGQRASGALVTKWDDDDWYAPEHLDDLIAAMRCSGGAVVGKAAEFVYLSSLDLTMRRFSAGAESFSTTIAGGTLMLTRETLRSIGGWPAGPRRVDRLLIEAVEDAGGTVYRCHGHGYVLRRDSDPGRHTWQVEDDYFLAQAVEQRSGLDLPFAGVTS